MGVGADLDASDTPDDNALNADEGNVRGERESRADMSMKLEVGAIVAGDRQAVCASSKELPQHLLQCAGNGELAGGDGEHCAVEIQCCSADYAGG